MVKRLMSNNLCATGTDKSGKGVKWSEWTDPDSRPTLVAIGFSGKRLMDSGETHSEMAEQQIRIGRIVDGHFVEKRVNSRHNLDRKI